MDETRLNTITVEELQQLKKEDPDLIAKELYNLAGDFLRKKVSISPSEYYDFVQTLVTKAWITLDKFDDEKANFTTFIYKVFLNEVYMISRARRAKRRQSGYVISLDREVTDTDEIAYIDTIQDLSRKDVLTEMIEEECLEITKSMFRPITLDYLNGMKQRELAEKYNISQSYVSRIIRKDIKQAKEKIK